MTTTSTLRNWWAPPCTGPFKTVDLHGEGRVTVRASVVGAVQALDACLKRHDYRTRKVDTGAYNCRRITGGTGWSLHAYGTAVDINWQSNPYGKRLITDMPDQMVADIKDIRTVNGKRVWRWGGDYSGNKDAMHFEIVCHPNDLATGIDPNTLPKTSNIAANAEDEVMHELEILKAFDRWLFRLPSDTELKLHTLYSKEHGIAQAWLNIANSDEAKARRK